MTAPSSCTDSRLFSWKNLRGRKTNWSLHPASRAKIKTHRPTRNVYRMQDPAIWNPRRRRSSDATHKRLFGRIKVNRIHCAPFVRTWQTMHWEKKFVSRRVIWGILLTIVCKNDFDKAKKLRHHRSVCVKTNSQWKAMTVPEGNRNLQDQCCQTFRSLRQSWICNLPASSPKIPTCCAAQRSQLF